MTKFEQFLIDKGYLKFIFNGETFKYEPTDKHVISTMVNLNHSYFPSWDTNALDKIHRGVKSSEFTYNDHKNEIIFGLREKGKPPTLITPRPKIEVRRVGQVIFKKDKDGVFEVKEGEVIESEVYDDSMNIVLQSFPHEDIFQAMYDKSIVFKIDLINEK